MFRVLFLVTLFPRLDDVVSSIVAPNNYLGWVDGAGVAVINTLQFQIGSTTANCTEQLDAQSIYMLYRQFLTPFELNEVMVAAGFDYNGTVASEHLMHKNQSTRLAKSRIFSALLPFWFYRDHSSFNRVAASGQDLFLNFAQRSGNALLTVSQDGTRINSALATTTNLTTLNSAVSWTSSSVRICADGLYFLQSDIVDISGKAEYPMSVSRSYSVSLLASGGTAQTFNQQINNSVGLLQFYTGAILQANLDKGRYFTFTALDSTLLAPVENSVINPAATLLKISNQSEQNSSTLQEIGESNTGNVLNAQRGAGSMSKNSFRPVDGGLFAYSYAWDAGAPAQGGFKGAALINTYPTAAVVGATRATDALGTNLGANTVYIVTLELNQFRHDGKGAVGARFS
ncbi:MAG: hypothetical protein EBU85_07650 [Actinobacteria bacterium]|nr:hypothetical protein [Actinomycetota bacterium]